MSRWPTVLTTPRRERRGFRGSRPGVPASQPTADGCPVPSDISSTGISTGSGAYGKTCRQAAPGQVPFPAGQARRVRDLHPVRGDRKVLDAQVHPDNGARRGGLPRVSRVNGEAYIPAATWFPGDGHRRRVEGGRVDGEAYIPAATWFPGDGHRRRVEGGRVDLRPRPHERQRRAGLGQPQRRVLHPERAAGVGRGLAPLTGLEPRIPGPLREERAESAPYAIPPEPERRGFLARSG